MIYRNKSTPCEYRVEKYNISERNDQENISLSLKLFFRTRANIPSINIQILPVNDGTVVARSNFLQQIFG